MSAGLFDAVQYVGTPLALVAFVVAAAAYVYRLRLTESRRSIEAASESGQLTELQRLLDGFGAIDTGNLTREQKYKLVLRQLSYRAKKTHLVAVTGIVVAVLLAVTILAVTFVQARPVTTGLTVRVEGPQGVDERMDGGTVALQIGPTTLTETIEDGRAVFNGVPSPAGAKIRIVPGVEDYRPENTRSTELERLPADGQITLVLVPLTHETRVWGTVLEGTTPLPGARITFHGGLARATTDEHGQYRTTLPLAPGSEVSVTIVHEGVVSVGGIETVPGDSPLDLPFHRPPR